MKQTEIKIPCADGFELTGTLYEPEQVKAVVMIGPATGIKRRFYNSFAAHLAENGYVVITFDNRGIGDSIKGNINEIGASLINWGSLDMTAVLKKLKETFPNQKYHLVGHSAGGQLVGLMKNAEELTSLFNFACSSGSTRNLHYPFKFMAHFFMDFFIPLSNLLFGKANVHWVGMGEPLPKLVATQWSKWCGETGYVATDFGKAIKQHKYDDITFPSLWVHATDDDIANLKNVKDMIRIFTKMKAKIITLDPKETGHKEIGHMKIFSRKNKDLWQIALDWLNKFN